MQIPEPPLKSTESDSQFSCCCSVAKSCLILCNPRDCKPTRLLCAWDFPGKNTGVRCHFLLQGIFLTQGSNLGLLHSGGSPALQADSLSTEPPGKPMYLCVCVYVCVCVCVCVCTCMCLCVMWQSNLLEQLSSACLHLT